MSLYSTKKPKTLAAIPFGNKMPLPKDYTPAQQLILQDADISHNT